MSMPPEDQTPRTEGPTPRADKARAGMSEELREITEAIGQLVDHMDQSLPEERMKELVTAAVTEERRGRTRLIVAMVSPLLVVLAVALATLAQSNSNHDQVVKIQKTAEDAKTVSDYVKHCLIAPVPERDTKECGADDSGAVIKGLIGSINCSLLIPPAERSEEKLNACAAKAFGQ